MMSDWAQFFASLQAFHENIARLLMDVDDLLAAHGLVPPQNRETNVGTQTSAQLDKAAQWTPGWVTRHYAPASNPSQTPRVFVAVLIASRRGDDLPHLAEPVVSAGVWTYQKGKGWWYWMGKAWAWSAERPTDGSIVARSLDYGGVKATAQCFAVPLSSLKSVDDLETQVVARLVAIESALT